MSNWFMKCKTIIFITHKRSEVIKMKHLIITLLFAISITFAGYLTPELQSILDTLSTNAKTNVIVHLVEQGDLSILPDMTPREQKIDYLKDIAKRTQEPILSYLNAEGEKVENVKSFWLTNCIAFSAIKEIIISITQRIDISYVTDDFIIQLNIEEGNETTEWNISKVKADSCWVFGYTG